MKFKLVLPLILLSGLAMSATALAEDVFAKYNLRGGMTNGRTVIYNNTPAPTNVRVRSVDIVVTNSVGKPVPGAQIKVYTPDNNTTPWITGNSNIKGTFTFTPNSSKLGLWSARVQKSQDTTIIYIPIQN
ncbi:MAG: hypothetical protein KME06_10345 [Kastovskya adunca ATA6-11-RM4]|nr:hypothetical protein [Kastovskya adunca ATA6-11-RM4]